MAIRVLRVLEYTYENEQVMIEDMQRWGVQGTHVVPGRGESRARMIIKSAVVSPEFVKDEDK